MYQVLRLVFPTFVVFSWLLLFCTPSVLRILFRVCCHDSVQLPFDWKMNLLFIRFNHTSWVMVVTATDSPKLVRNRCVIEVFGGVFCVLKLLFGFFSACRGICHRIESDLFPFLYMFIYWKEKETHILTFQISDLLYEQILSWYQQFIPTNTDD